MRKFELNNNNTASTSTKTAVQNASPLTKAFVAKIMEKYSSDNKKPELSETETQLQKAFSSWPVDEFTKRLATLTEILTGFKPEIGGAGWKIGGLFKVNDVIYAAINNVPKTSNLTVYGVNVKANAYSDISNLINLTEGHKQFVTAAEAGQFAKEFLAVNGKVFLQYIISTFGQVYTQAILELVDIV